MKNLMICFLLIFVGCASGLKEKRNLIDDFGSEPPKKVKYVPAYEKYRTHDKLTSLSLSVFPDPLMIMSVLADGDTTVRYRKSSGEVLKISPKGQSFAFLDTTFWGIFLSANFPDGIDSTPLRQLGIAKIALPGTPNVVRNATQAEIDTFAVRKVNDKNIQDREVARDFLRLHPRFRKVLIALIDILIDEINLLRDEHALTNRTLQQAKNAILNRISENQ